MDEFSLIRTIFQRPELTTAGGQLDMGIGDDCALVPLSSEHQLVQSIDTLVADVHFPAGGDPFLIGYRSLAVSVSDLAAMGATPHSFFLALTLPEADTKWLEQFSNGLAAMAKEAGISLAGGDTTCGPLTISVHVQGFVPKGRALMRSGGKPGDLIYVSGHTGEACAALPYILNQRAVTTKAEQKLVDRYWQPTPRIKLGQWLLEHGATAAIDISDGLAGDLGHILKASGCGAELNSSRVPISPELKETCGEWALDKALCGGDDYELCFCWPAGKAIPSDIPVTARNLGFMTDRSEQFLIDGQDVSNFCAGSYRHF
ncbi:thiamine-phosphate kinase [Sansalvadorimonas sp. 2012CJ34-2]|uniref:Thiamine-monophosphate kinase n=1 Tax=Parendozoicomonas callyspongiae TaxID=2942213 RepID=A0ABT0PGH0_9GAMM|nr:thiamine-phosphate kinase [Sansalvadorimonas sp. 2012CJ34-2]MCL6270477.1 thiamine-phosphate kinase [Sansalvadorimonas sp. 2012CJ34-2]